MSEWVPREKKSFRLFIEVWFRARGEDSVFIRGLARLLEKPYHFGDEVTKGIEFEARQLFTLLHEALTFSSIGNSSM